MIDMELTRDDGVVLSDDASRLDFEAVFQWLSVESYWAAGRAAQTIRRSLENSRCYGAYAPGGEQIALARVVTDDATFAWVCDVYVDAAYRGRGIGNWLMRSLVDDLTALGLNRILLATADAHGVYRRVGFESLTGADRYMEIDNRPNKTVLMGIAARQAAPAR
jgi:GNAT superfamily N-acetyltransferase